MHFSFRDELPSYSVEGDSVFTILSRIFGRFYFLKTLAINNTGQRSGKKKNHGQSLAVNDTTFSTVFKSPKFLTGCFLHCGFGWDNYPDRSLEGRSSILFF